MLSIPLAIIGFKKQNKILAALSLLLITGSFGLAEVYHKRKAITGDSTEVVSNDGKTLFEAKCALCHGGDGKLGAAGAKDLSGLTSSVEEIKSVILNGKNSMPASDVTPEQAAAIADYVVANIQGK